MLRHVVMIKWKPEITASQLDVIEAGLRALPAQIDAIRAYTLGQDARLGEGRWDFAVVADFDDADGWAVYDQHPAHVAVRSNDMIPFIAERATIQFAV